VVGTKVPHLAPGIAGDGIQLTFPSGRACQNWPVPVHEIAERGFGSQADAYERSRPSYPPEAVGWLVEHLAIGNGSVVVDLAAGTGKLTRVLTGTGRVIAIEPVDGMRAVLHERLPFTPTVAGLAEQLPLAEGSVDAVTVAQAFHWFDADAAWRELARVVRPGGRVALIWNTRDRSIPWVDAVWSIVDRVERNDRWQRHGSWLETTNELPAEFSPFEHARFAYEQHLDRAGVDARVTGVSHVAALEADARARVLDEIHDVLAGDPSTRDTAIFTLPYRTDAAVCERR